MGKKILYLSAGILWICAATLLAATTSDNTAKAAAVPAKAVVVTPSAPAANPAVVPAKAPAATVKHKAKTSARTKAKAKAPAATPTATATETATVTETETATVAATPAATTATPAATVVTSATGASSSLPKEGAIAWNVGIAGWQASFQDIQDIYGGGLTDPTPFGGEFDLGADLTLAPCFQLGLQAQGIARAPEELHLNNDLYTDTWNVYAVGGALVMKYLIPLQDKFNLIIHGEGGYYSLVASTITGGGAASGSVNLDASNFGGMGCLEAEMLLDANNGVALDIGLGYRYLKMTPIKLSGTYSGIPVTGNLPNSAGGDATLDLSGLRLNATFRFY